MFFIVHVVAVTCVFYILSSVSIPEDENEMLHQASREVAFENISRLSAKSVSFTTYHLQKCCLRFLATAFYQIVYNIS